MKAWKLLTLSCALLLTTGVASGQSATDVNCTGCVGNGDVAGNAITTNKIANGQVRNTDLGTNSVTSGKIKDGTVALADLSADIQQYVNATIADVYLSLAYDEGESFMGVSCPVDSIPISSSCACNGDGVETNFGVLDFCAVIELEGAVASCAYDALTYDPGLSPPTAQVQATCISGETNDGTPWVPGIILPTGSSPVSGGKSPLQGPMADMQSVLARMRAQRAVYDARLLERGK